MATDHLDDMPKIRLDKDDLESFHRTRSQSSKKRLNRDNLPDEPTIASSTPSWFAILFLLIIIIGAASYWSFEQYKVLKQDQRRITQLENRLSSKGEDMDQSAAALQIKVTELSAKTEDLWAQMDKLWASAWRRNQTEIGTLNKTLMELKASTERSTEILSIETTDNNTNVGFVKGRLENQATLLQELNEKFGQINNVDADFEKQLASIREKLISTALTNNDLANQIDDLRRRVIAAESKLRKLKVSTTPSVTPT